MPLYLHCEEKHGEVQREFPLNLCIRRKKPNKLIPI